MKDNSKGKPLQRTDVLTYVPLGAMSSLNGNEYKMLTYILFRNNLDGYKLFISTMVDETGLSKMSVLRLCKKFAIKGFLTQDGNGHYQCDYNNCHKWIWSEIDKKSQNGSGNKLIPPLVTNCDQSGNKMIPVGNKLIPELVTKSYHTDTKENFIDNNKESIKQVGKIADSANTDVPVSQSIPIPPELVSQIERKELFNQLAIVKNRPEQFDTVFDQLFKKRAVTSNN